MIYHIEPSCNVRVLQYCCCASYYGARKPNTHVSRLTQPFRLESPTHTAFFICPATFILFHRADTAASAWDWAISGEHALSDKPSGPQALS